MNGAILLDTNLTVLFVIGSTNTGYIKNRKRLGAYDIKDFEILTELLSTASDIIFCPNVLTEASNLLGRKNDTMGAEISAKFSQIVSNASERYVESREAVSQTEHNRLGLTDAVLLILAKTGATLLTADLDLYVAAASASLRAVNYFHIQELRSDFQ